MTIQHKPPPEHVETCLFDLDDCLYRNPEFPRDMAINIQGEAHTDHRLPPPPCPSSTISCTPYSIMCQAERPEHGALDDSHNAQSG